MGLVGLRANAILMMGEMMRISLSGVASRLRSGARRVFGAQGGLLLPRWGACLLACALPSCSHLPADGPDSFLISSQSSGGLDGDSSGPAVDYVVMDITPNVLKHVSEGGPGSFYRSFGLGYGPAPDFRVRIGDTLVVSIFEHSEGGLFVPSNPGVRPGNFVSLPAQVVDSSGNIAVPFAGEIHAQGRTLRQIKSEIEKRLTKRALEPQVIVTLPTSDQSTATATIVGDGVGAANVVRLRPSGEQILEVISRSGGIRYPGYETLVTIQRGRRRATVNFQRLVNDPHENIYIRPGDVIHVHRYQRKFAAFGALNSATQVQGLTGQFNFESEKVTLHEGLSRTGGLVDGRANAWEVYLYRTEKRKTLEAMGAGLRKFDPRQKMIPTIYRLNLRDPSGFFLAQHFPMRDKDIIYVSNARSVEVAKFFDYIQSISGGIAGVTADIVTTREGVRALSH
jgi:polysaccharide export outer membrane protein